MDDVKTGIVVKSTGSFYRVLSGNDYYKCRIRGKLKIKGFKSTNPIAVGDKVVFTKLNDDEGVISEILERKNCIIRQATNLSKRTHILASNVDQAIIVVSLKSPATPIEFIDRFLVSSDTYGISAKIIFNKIDIYGEKEMDLMSELTETYKNIGYKCYHISSKEKLNIETIKKLLKDKISSLVGNSGVGKSTLVNTLSPNLNLKTASVSEKYQTGKHITTFAEMHKLSFGGFIIDTPGIRAFGTSFIDKETIAHNFPEMFNLLGKCKYYNCRHIEEPDCAVKKAFEEGKIAFSRYKSYLSMMLEDGGKHRKDPFGNL